MPEDIAVLTGGKMITEDLGIKLENVKLADLGRAKRVTIVKRALEEQIRQIVINAGVEGAVIVMEVKKNKRAAYGPALCLCDVRRLCSTPPSLWFACTSTAML